MADPNDSTGSTQREEDDAGAPIAELRDLSVDVDDRFGRRVRGRIERRVLTAELVALAWTAPSAVLLEVLRLSFERFGRRTGK